jgi:heat shock protein HslJ
MSIGAVALVSVAAAGCATATGGTGHQSGATPQESTSPKPAPSAEDGFAGYKWQVVAIDHAGKETPIPARYNVYLAFTPNGEFGANDPVNYHGGTYRADGDGFTTRSKYSSVAGYIGKDPVTLLAVNAISAFNSGVHATATVTGDQLTVSVGGYVLTCQRDGTPG